MSLTLHYTMKSVNLTYAYDLYHMVQLWQVQTLQGDLLICLWSFKIIQPMLQTAKNYASVTVFYHNYYISNPVAFDTWTMQPMFISRFKWSNIHEIHPTAPRHKVGLTEVKTDQDHSTINKIYV